MKSQKCIPKNGRWHLLLRMCTVAACALVVFAMCVAINSSWAQEGQEQNPENNIAEQDAYSQEVYRLYNTITSEHLFTTGQEEYNVLKKEFDTQGVGWKGEGVGWYNPSISNIGVYRLYNPALGALSKMSHHYTTSKSEADELATKWGWVYDNNSSPIFYSAEYSAGNTMPCASGVYRLYNGGLAAHHFTTNKTENDSLIANSGWKGEDVGFRAYEQTDTVKTDSSGVAVVADKSQNNRLTKVVVTEDSASKTNSLSSARGIANVTVTIDNNGNIIITFPQKITIQNIVIDAYTIAKNESDSKAVDDRPVVVYQNGASDSITGKTDSKGETRFDTVIDFNNASVASDNLVYTGSAIEPAVTIDGLEQGRDFEVEYANNTNAGTGSATVKGIGNYSGEKTYTFTIAKAPLSYAWHYAASSYDGNAHVPTLSVSGAVGSQSITPSVTYTKEGSTDAIDAKDVINAGKYTATATLSDADAANYAAPANTTQNFEITKTSLKYTWVYGAAKYDGKSHKPSLVVTDGNDEKVSITPQVSYASSDGTTFGENDNIVNAGTYTATATLSATDAANCTAPQNTTFTFEIEKVNLTFNWTYKNATYNGAAHTPTLSVTSDAGSLRMTPTVTYVKQGDTAQIAAANVKDAGTYTATATLSGVDVANYNLPSNTTYDFTIGKANLTFTWTSVVASYDGASHTPSLSVSGAASGQSIKPVVTYVNDSGTAVAAPINAGKYTATAALSEKDAVNYNVPANSTKSFEIGKANIEFKWDYQAAAFDGKSHTPTISVTGAPLGQTVTPSVTYTKEGDTSAVAAPTNAGKYTATAALSAADAVNYNLPSNATKNFEITKTTLSYDWTYTAASYDGASHTPTVSVSGVPSGQTVTPSVTYAKEGESTQIAQADVKNAGTYIATATLSETAAANYNLPNNTTYTFKITKADPTYVKPDTLTGVRGDTLADVAIPAVTGGTFTWEASDTTLDKVGTQTFSVLFTPSDTTNYNTADDRLTVLVKDFYTVTFDADGGDPEPEAQKVVEGDKAQNPASDPERKGYTFEGWTLNDSDYNFDTVPTSNITLKAKWTAKDHNVVVAVTGTGTNTASISAETAADVQDLYADTDDVITVKPVADNDNYIAQVRYGTRATGTTDEYAAYTAVKAAQDGTYTFAKPADDVKVYVDFVSKVWDGTMDVTWYDPEATEIHLQYAAQYEGLAAIVNGIFTTYPTKTIPQTGSVDEHQVPDYDAYLTGMGADFEVNTVKETDASSGTETEKEVYNIKSNNLYGEFSATYDLVDMQVGTTETVTGITKTARVVGDAKNIVSYSSVGSHGGNNQVTTSTYFYGDDDMNGKKVYIDADLDFGGTKTAAGAWDTSSPLFMSPAGQYAMLPQNGFAVLGSSFNGTLDGLGHKFENVYAERYAAGGNFGDSQSLGIIGRLGNHDGDPKEIAAVNPTVRQIVFESGWMSARRSSGCIVGKIGQTSATKLADGSTGGIIEYCINKADIIGTDKKGIGGIVGAGWNKGVVRYCANFGSVKCRLEYAPGSGFMAGGIVGSCEVPVIGCYNVGDVLTGNTGTSRYSEAIGTNNGSCTWTDCFYLYGSDHNTSYPGVYYGTSTNVKSFGTNGDYENLEAWMPNGWSSASEGGTQIWFDDTENTGVNAKDGVNYPLLFFQSDKVDTEKEYTITITQPAEGKVSASSTKVKYGESITLSNEVTNQFYKFKAYKVNGVETTKTAFTVTSDMTVEAEYVALNKLTFSIEDCTDKDWTITAKKTGIVSKDGVATKVENADLNAGDTIYEGDVITIYPVIKEGATPADVSKEYTGRFSCRFYTSADHSTALNYNATRTVDANVTYFEGSVMEAYTQDKVWLSLADTSWYEGHESDSEYTITTAAQLAGVSKLVYDSTTNKQTTNFSGKTIKLGQDISLANTDGTSGTRAWSCIGAAYSSLNDNAFAGTFDGQNHKITDMYIPQSEVTGNFRSYRGLFAFANGATIKDVDVSGTINTCYSNTYIGSVVASAKNTTIDGCTSNVTINGISGTYYTASVGGIIGYSEGCTIKNCTNKGNIEAYTGSSTWTSTGVGGILGNGKSTTAIENCVNAGNVSSPTDKSCTAYIAGIAGYLEKASITKASNSGNITAGSNSANACGAGIVAYGSTVPIDQCANTGTITSSKSVAAGIAGYIYYEGKVTNSYNQGAVSTLNSSNAYAYAGGLVGSFNWANATMENCYNTGAVTSAYAGIAAATVPYFQSGKTLTATNVFYLDSTAKTKDASVTGAVSKTDAELKGAATLTALGDKYKASSGSYPVLAWES